MTDSEDKGILLAVRVTPSTADALSAIANTRKVNRSIVIRWAFDAYIEAFFMPVCPSEKADTAETVAV